MLSTTSDAMFQIELGSDQANVCLMEDSPLKLSRLDHRSSCGYSGASIDVTMAPRPLATRSLSNHRIIQGSDT